MLDVTVCILSYNRSEFLRESLLSVLSQVTQPRKIAIYDNGSDKRVYENIQNLLDDRVQWFGSDVNHPFMWNFYRAMNGCDTRYVIMLHDDDRLCPGFLEAQIGLMETNHDLVAVSCNGHVIDEKGSKIGRTLAATEGAEPINLLTCSGQVAMKYAANSCVPFSPTVYRVEVARKVKFREEFGKVCDAVFFCDLAEFGSIGYQANPLYECRMHAGQDSSHFPFDLLNQLEEFYWSRTCADDIEKNKLHTLLLNQHAARNLKQIAFSLRNGNLRKAVALFGDPKFKLRNVAQEIGVRILKFFYRR